ncbi:MAG: hypothetical protein OXU74_07850 [Gemmatimonadota bacterium]|nr:hypothetical protein [Gemmatimonadota bacterium]
MNAAPAKGRSPLAVLAPITLLALSCAPTPDDAPGATTTPATADDVLRTADPYTRGYTDDDFSRVQELAPGVYSYEQLRSAGDERFTTVSMFVVTDEGVLVADGQGSPEETRRLVETIAGITDRPITHVIVCSDHGDHTAGNSEFPADARFYAHPTSQAVLLAAADNPGRPADAPPVVVPTHLVETRETLQLGGREIQLLFMSEAYLNRIFPAMRSAYPSEWVAMIEAAQALDVTTYVPGHGFVDPPAVLAEELETYRQAVVQVIAEATRLHAAGLTLEEAVAEADFGALEGWSLHASQAPTAIGRVYMELNGELPRP